MSKSQNEIWYLERATPILISGMKIIFSAHFDGQDISGVGKIDVTARRDEFISVWIYHNGDSYCLSEAQYALIREVPDSEDKTCLSLQQSQKD